MKLHIVDILIICAYLMVIVAIGLFLKKKAAKNMDSYFLGGKSLPFYMLGLSNASGMFDITGTMLMVYWAFAYGFKSLWIPWLWPVFNQIFLMVYLSVWLRRQCADGRRMDKDPFRAGAGGYALAYYCHCLCSAQRAGLLELRVYRNRQVHGDLFSVGGSVAVCALGYSDTICASFLRHFLYGHCYLLCDAGRYAQHCVDGCGAVPHHDGGGCGHCHYRDEHGGS